MNPAARRAKTRRQRQWRARQRAHRAVWEVEGGECELTMLIRSQWLLEADADDPCKEADHRVCTVLWRSRLELVKSFSFDFLELLAHDAKPYHVALKLRTCVARQRRSFRSAQLAEFFMSFA